MQERRIGHLHEEDPVARDCTDGAEVSVAGEDVESVQHETDRRMAGAAHHLPGVAVVVDVASPGQGLEADAQAARFGPFAECVQVGRGAVDTAERVGRHVAADHEKVAAQLLHDVELALGAGEGSGALVVGQALEVAEGLQRDHLQAQIARLPGARRLACRWKKGGRSRRFRRHRTWPQRWLPASRRGYRSEKRWRSRSSWLTPLSLPGASPCRSRPSRAQPQRPGRCGACGPRQGKSP